jgi:hypothetical protein
MEKVNLIKTSYDKNQYEKVIDNKFSQLANTTILRETTPTSEQQNFDIEEFFSSYDDLFFRIPKLGEVNSHEYLIKRSTEYVGSILTNDEIQALIDEINLLQQQNLELNQQLVELQISGSR